MVEETPKGSKPFLHGDWRTAAQFVFESYQTVCPQIPISCHYFIFIFHSGVFCTGNMSSRFSEFFVTTNQLNKVTCPLFIRLQSQQEQKHCFWYFCQIVLSSYLLFNNLSIAFLEIHFQGSSCNIFSNDLKLSQNLSG